MDNSTFSAYREKIGATLTHRLNDAYAQHAISEDESPVVAKFILDRIDAVNNHAELMAFLEELTQKWPLFGPVLVMENSQAIEEGNQTKASAIEQLIKEDKIDEALQTAEQTNQEQHDTTPPQQNGGTN